MMKNEGRDSYSMNYQETTSYNTMPDMSACMPPCPCSSPCETMCPPICECPQNQVCHRVMNYNVPHIIPMHTTTVNHHIYNHTYTPVYSYSEVDEVENIYQNRCCR